MPNWDVFEYSSLSSEQVMVFIVLKYVCSKVFVGGILDFFFLIAHTTRHTVDLKLSAAIISAEEKPIKKILSKLFIVFSVVKEKTFGQSTRFTLQ